MNSNAFLKNRWIILALVFLFQSCLPLEYETIAFVEIPEQFLQGWTVGIRCANAEFDAMMIDFELEDSKEFTAIGIGTDYDGDELIGNFSAIYDSKTDSISGQIEITVPGSEYVRIDEFGFHIGSYNGELMDMQLITERIGNMCDTQIHFEFDE